MDSSVIFKIQILYYMIWLGAIVAVAYMFMRMYQLYVEIRAYGINKKHERLIADYIERVQETYKETDVVSRASLLQILNKMRYGILCDIYPLQYVDNDLFDSILLDGAVLNTNWATLKKGQEISINRIFRDKAGKYYGYCDTFRMIYPLDHLDPK